MLMHGVHSPEIHHWQTHSTIVWSVASVVSYDEIESSIAEKLAHETVSREWWNRPTPTYD